MCDEKVWKISAWISFVFFFFSALDAIYFFILLTAKTVSESNGVVDQIDGISHIFFSLLVIHSDRKDTEEERMKKMTWNLCCSLIISYRIANNLVNFYCSEWIRSEFSNCTDQQNFIISFLFKVSIFWFDSLANEGWCRLVHANNTKLISTKSNKPMYVLSVHFPSHRFDFLIDAHFIRCLKILW